MVNRYYNSKLGQTEMYLSLVCHKKAARPGAMLSSQCEFNLTVVRDISATLMSVFVITLETLSGHILSLYGPARQIDLSD